MRVESFFFYFVKNMLRICCNNLSTSPMSVRCFADSEFRSFAYTWTNTADAKIGDSLSDKISSFTLAPWSKVEFWADKNFTGDRATFINDNVTPLERNNLKDLRYDTNGGRNLNDSITSLKVSSLPVPACASSMSAYLTQYPDVAAAKMNPWTHYSASGSAEGRFWGDNTCDGRANACSSVKNKYWELYPDVKATGMDAWQHFIQSGRAEGRAWPGIACDGSTVLTDSAPYAAVLLALTKTEVAAADKARSDAELKRAADAARNFKANAPPPTPSDSDRVDTATKQMDTVQPVSDVSGSGSNGSSLDTKSNTTSSASTDKSDDAPADKPADVPKDTKTKFATWKIALVVVAAIVIAGMTALAARRQSAKKNLAEIVTPA